ncbi:MAG TPA: cytochrome b/b6 domain-containing protein [Opitutus sp.]|nr:cytochrome b/b6 domain-containing protein [Opitutus sp.]
MFRPRHVWAVFPAPRGGKGVPAWLRAGWIAALLVTALAPARGIAGESAPSAGCLECHGDRQRMTGEPAGAGHALFVDGKVLGGSAHGSLDCTDCHENLEGAATPHRAKPVPVDCVSCHDDIAKRHKFHARLLLKPRPAGADTDCTGCHGTHAVAALKSRQFPFAKAQLTEGCGRCHAKARDDFVRSLHGRPPSAVAAAAPNCLTCHADPAIAADGEHPPIEQKLAQVRLCESCHVEKKDVAQQAVRGTRFVASFEQSVHGVALKAGKTGAPTCVDCHGAHEMNRAIAASARINKLRQPATCAKCHEQQAREYDESVHAVALRKGNFDSAVCTDCHGEHDIRGHKDPTSPVHAANVARQACAACHASVRLTKKYGLSSQAFQTFSDSYHGLAARGGALEVVNCASCHSAHAIKASTDPTSTVYKGNLVRTCGECHPGANTRFTVGRVHVDANGEARQDGGDPLLYLIATIYVWLIAVVVGGMAAHNLIDFLKKIRRKLAIQKGLVEPEVIPHRLYLRMTVHERLQHGVLVISFVLLVVTGFMFHYPDAWWVAGIRNLSARAFEWRGIIHRVAGVVMLAAGAWHVGYLAFTKPGRALFRDLRPRWRDCTDPWKVLRYNLGLAPTKPAFPRFSYIEKAEYWALVWGTLLMGVTGVVLWFENTSMGLITKLGFDASRTIHFYEAILATLAIIVWHFYFVIFNPDVYPMNLAWLTGRMSEEELHEEHPLELARLKAAEAAAKSPPPTAEQTPPPGPLSRNNPKPPKGEEL